MTSALGVTSVPCAFEGITFHCSVMPYHVTSQATVVTTSKSYSTFFLEGWMNSCVGRVPAARPRQDTTLANLARWVHGQKCSPLYPGTKWA